MSGFLLLNLFDCDFRRVRVRRVGEFLAAATQQATALNALATSMPRLELRKFTGLSDIGNLIQLALFERRTTSVQRLDAAET
jgi:hypothetical protein